MGEKYVVLFHGGVVLTYRFLLPPPLEKQNKASKRPEIRKRTRTSPVS